MEINNRCELYEKLYFHEIAERDKLDGRLRILLSIFAFVFALLAFWFNKVVIANRDINVFFGVTYTLGVGIFLFSIYCFIRAWHGGWKGHKYLALPKADVIEEYIEDIRTQYRTASENEEETEKWTAEAYSDYLRTAFMTYSSFNTNVNGEKRYWLYRCTTSIIASFVLIAFSYVCFYPNTFGSLNNADDVKQTMENNDAG